MEQWKLVPNFEKYEVSDRGRIRSKVRNKKSGKILNMSLNTMGRYQVEIGEKPNKKKFLVHRLVMKAFVGPCPKGMEVNHLDRNPTNNCLLNLEYCTPKQNTHHAIENGGGSYFGKGETNPYAKLTPLQVIEIKKLISKGYSHRLIGTIFNVAMSTISNISQKRNWNWL